MMYSYINNYPNNRENGWSNELQGVTNDGENWYFTQKGTLWKFPVSHDLNTKITKSDPANGIYKVSLDMEGYNHFGDLDYYEGKLFVPIEGGEIARLAVYNASDLQLLGYSHIMHNTPKRNAPWCAINPTDGLLYTSVFDDVDYLLAYHFEILNDGSLHLTLVRKFFIYNENGSLLRLDRIQGGVFSGQSAYLYLVCDAHNSSNGIYVIDSTTGKQVDKITVDYKPTSWGYTAEELEGITIWDLDNSDAPNVSGQLHLIMIDNVGTNADDLYFKHFTVDMEKVGAVPVQNTNKNTLIFNYLGNYPKGRESGWSDNLQGVTHDQDNWFFTQTDKLWKFPVTHDLKTKVTTANPSKGILKVGMPDELTNRGYDHYGDFCYYDGFLFIPVTHSSIFDPIIAVFKASDLSYVTHHVMPQFTGLGWCTINHQNGRLYTSDKHLSDNSKGSYSPIVYFEINMDKLKNQGLLLLNELGTLILKTLSGSSVTLKHIQGGTFDDDNHLYILNGYMKDFDEKEGGISVFNAQTGIRVARSSSGSGTFNYEFHPGWSKYEEPEGLTYWNLGDGRAPNIKGMLHAIMLDNDITSKDDLNFKHYDKVLIDNNNANTDINLDKLYIANTNSKSKEVHQRYCSWADNIAIQNKRYYSSLQKALDDGYDGCYYCLRAYHSR